MIETGLRALDWLMELQTSAEGYFAPIGSEGFYERGGGMARFDQQPVEAFTMLDACIEAHNCTADDKYLRYAHTCLNWFLGNNDMHLAIYDHSTGGCRDGLHPKGVNENQGAESTLAWLMSLLTLYRHRSHYAMPQVPSEANGKEATEAEVAGGFDAHEVTSSESSSDE
jgi:hypothetical protein